MSKLDHLAIIMDGNARWANKHNKTKAQGHKQGATTAKLLLPYASKLGIKYLLYIHFHRKIGKDLQMKYLY